MTEQRVVSLKRKDPEDHLITERIQAKKLIGDDVAYLQRWQDATLAQEADFDMDESFSNNSHNLDKYQADEVSTQDIVEPDLSHASDFNQNVLDVQRQIDELEQEISQEMEPAGEVSLAAGQSRQGDLESEAQIILVENQIVLPDNHSALPDNGQFDIDPQQALQDEDGDIIVEEVTEPYVSAEQEFDIGDRSNVETLESVVNSGEEILEHENNIDHEPSEEPGDQFNTAGEQFDDAQPDDDSKLVGDDANRESVVELTEVEQMEDDHTHIEQDQEQFVGVSDDAHDQVEVDPVPADYEGLQEQSKSFDADDGNAHHDDHTFADTTIPESLKNECEGADLERADALTGEEREEFCDQGQETDHDAEQNGTLEQQTADLPAEVEYEVDQIVDHKFEDNCYWFLIQWKGLPHTWEPENHLRGCWSLVEQYAASHSLVLTKPNFDVNEEQPEQGDAQTIASSELVQLVQRLGELVGDGSLPQQLHTDLVLKLTDMIETVEASKQLL
eukprot:c7371_g1_i3.p1 GENE.c7371_g1_i3~~c7371_g1_i3.p1  ORF type:complete len:516 (-),score=115.57 c7371_g1_i3:92-1600(-)